jgi:hypothetical protein
MYKLILIVVSLGQYPTVTTTDFDSSMACHKAINYILEFEKNSSLKIKARCVEK